VLILPIQDVQPGMRLAMTVVNPAQPEQELLTAGYPLDELVLSKLRDLGIDVLYVEYPELADLDRHLRPYLTPARREIYAQIRAAFEQVQADARPIVNFATYYATTRQLITALLRQGQHPIYLDQMMGTLGADGVRHAAAVAHLALVMGLRLESYVVKQRRLPPDHAREVVNLGVGGMLHDIGKMLLPPALRNHTAVDEPAHPADTAAWQAHATESFEIIRPGVEASASAAVLHHHQHFDGSGFPRLMLRKSHGKERCVGERIHVFGRILLAADLYERLTLAPGGRRRAAVQVLHLMRTAYAGRVDPHIMKVLPSIIPPYPPGAAVKLSDGTYAVVTRFHPREPYYPTVRRATRNGWVMTGPPFTILPGSGPVIVAVCGTATGDAVGAAEPAPLA
jgi:HD-GYP domain-containing protein (c-di-GMP phosphodiesterase class II)